MSSADEIRSKLQQLGEKFLKRSSGELEPLRALIEKARGGDGKALEELRNLAHRMHGTGATLGFADVGEQAGRIEELTETRPVDYDAMAAIATKLEQLLRDAAARAGVSL